MAKQIYLSYSGRNCEAVLQVMERVIAMGCSLLCDCMLPQNGTFAERAEKNIRQADLTVAVITDDAADCSYMDTELRIALEIGTPLLCVVVDGAHLPPKHREALEALPMCPVSAYPSTEEMTAVAETIERW